MSCMSNGCIIALFGYDPRVQPGLRLFSYGLLNTVKTYGFKNIVLLLHKSLAEERSRLRNNILELMRRNGIVVVTVELHKGCLEVYSKDDRETIKNLTMEMLGRYNEIIYYIGCFDIMVPLLVCIAINEVVRYNLEVRKRIHIVSTKWTNPTVLFRGYHGIPLFLTRFIIFYGEPPRLDSGERKRTILRVDRRKRFQEKITDTFRVIAECIDGFCYSKIGAEEACSCNPLRILYRVDNEEKPLLFIADPCDPSNVVEAIHADIFGKNRVDEIADIVRNSVSWSGRNLPSNKEKARLIHRSIEEAVIAVKEIEFFTSLKPLIVNDIAGVSRGEELREFRLYSALRELLYSYKLEPRITSILIDTSVLYRGFYLELLRLRQSGVMEQVVIPEIAVLEVYSNLGENAKYIPHGRNPMHIYTRLVAELIEQITNEGYAHVEETPSYGTCESILAWLTQKTKSGYILIIM